MNRPTKVHDKVGIKPSEKVQPQKSELQLAIEAGYHDTYLIRNGRIYNLDDMEQVYAACQVVVGKCSCPVSKHIVYRIETPSGRKGTAIKTI